MKKLTLISFILTLGACGQQKELRPLDMALSNVMGYGKVEASFCTPHPAPAKEKLKYIFIVDHSASNQPGVPDPATPNDLNNTDPSGNRRYGPLVNFIKNLAPDVNQEHSFALINFNDDAFMPNDAEGFYTDQASFLADATQTWIGEGSEQSTAPSDKGFTNYHAALEMAFELIKKDATLTAQISSLPVVSTVYQVVFVSDGLPIVATSAGSIEAQTFAEDIEPVINDLLNLKNDVQLSPYISQINLNTAYYFTTNQVVEAQALLQQMADSGNGIYLQFGAGQNILYQQFALPGRNVIHNLVDVFVENENAVWWDDGLFMLDSDRDGLPDGLELQLNSNSYKADSDGNGVNDLVEYRMNGKPCEGALCAQIDRNPYSICAGFQPTLNAANEVTFSVSTNDGLNDCEKFVLGASRATFTTNGSLVPDFLALKNSLPVVPGSKGAILADPFGDGQTNYSKLKNGYPVQVSKNNLRSSFKPRVTTLTKVQSPSSDVDCYRLNVDNVALSGFENVIKVQVIVNAATGLDKPFMIQGRAQIDKGQKAIFTNESFK